MLYSARGHGGSPLPQAPAAVDHDLLGRDLERVADECAATRALGVSMGAGALLSLLARVPDRFERVVLVLPAALDRPRSDDAVRQLAVLADALDARDAGAVERLMREQVPADLRDLPGVEAHVRARTAHLLASPGVASAVRSLPLTPPVDDRSRLAAVSADVLVIAQQDDPLHPVQVARDLAAVLPRARLVVLERPGMLLRDRALLRRLVPAALAQETCYP